MAIEIIDGFKLSRSVPIDDRIVASGSSDRDLISNKYNGLRVFDIKDSTPYVWLDNSWVKENNNTLIATDLKDNYLIKFNNINKGLTNSLIIDNNQGIFINYTSLPTIDSNIKLDINGDVKASSFSGIGTNLTNLDASQIQSGLLDIKYIKPGNDGQVLATYKDTNDNTLKTKWDDIQNIRGFGLSLQESVSGYHYLIFGDTTDPVFYKSGDNGDMNGGTLKYNASNGQLLIKNNESFNSPCYSFIDDEDTGIYLIEVNKIGISIGGDLKTQIDINGIKTVHGTKTDPGISFISNSTSGIYFDSTNNSIGLSIAGTDISYIDSEGIKIIDGSVEKPSISTISNKSTGFYITGTEIGFSVNATSILKLTDTELNLNSDKFNINGSNPTIYFDNDNTIGYTSNGFNIKTNKTLQLESSSLKFQIDTNNYFNIKKDSNATLLSIYNNNKNVDFKLTDSDLTIVADSITFMKDSTNHADLQIGSLFLNDKLTTNIIEFSTSTSIKDIIGLSLSVKGFGSEKNYYQLTIDGVIQTLNITTASPHTYKTKYFDIALFHIVNSGMAISFTFRENSRTTKNRSHFLNNIGQWSYFYKSTFKIKDETTFVINIDRTPSAQQYHYAGEFAINLLTFGLTSTSS